MEFKIRLESFRIFLFIIFQIFPKVRCPLPISVTTIFECKQRQLDRLMTADSGSLCKLQTEARFSIQICMPNRRS